MKGNRLKSRDRYLEEAMLFRDTDLIKVITGVFGAIEPPKAVRRAFWDKKQKLKALSLKWVFETVPAFIPEADETRRRVIRRHLARDGAEN